jgi:hypothetical protein
MSDIQNFLQRKGLETNRGKKKPRQPEGLMGRGESNWRDAEKNAVLRRSEAVHACKAGTVYTFGDWETPNVQCHSKGKGLHL